MRLLPSDIARLVLGYLKDKGLKKTFVAFLQESPDLSEYWSMLNAGLMPTTSIMGLTLHTILEEYAALTLKVKALTAHLAQPSNGQPVSGIDPIVTSGLDKSDINAVVESHRKAELDRQHRNARQKAKRKRSGSYSVRVDTTRCQSTTTGSINPPEKGIDDACSVAQSKLASQGNASLVPGKVKARENLDEEFEFDTLDQLLADTKLHEKLAESINKALKRDQQGTSDQTHNASGTGRDTMADTTEQCGDKEYQVPPSPAITSASVAQENIDNIISMTAAEPGLEQLLSLFQFHTETSPNETSSSVQTGDKATGNATLYMPPIGSTFCSSLDTEKGFVAGQTHLRDSFHLNSLNLSAGSTANNTSGELSLVSYEKPQISENQGEFPSAQEVSCRADLSTSSCTVNTPSVCHGQQFQNTPSVLEHPNVCPPNATVNSVVANQNMKMQEEVNMGENSSSVPVQKTSSETEAIQCAKDQKSVVTLSSSIPSISSSSSQLCKKSRQKRTPKKLHQNITSVDIIHASTTGAESLCENLTRTVPVANNCAANTSINSEATNTSRSTPVPFPECLTQSPHKDRNHEDIRVVKLSSKDSREKTLSAIGGTEIDEITESDGRKRKWDGTVDELVDIQAWTEIDVVKPAIGSHKKTCKDSADNFHEGEKFQSLSDVQDCTEKKTRVENCLKVGKDSPTGEAAQPVLKESLLSVPDLKADITDFYPVLSSSPISKGTSATPNNSENQQDGQGKVTSLVSCDSSYITCKTDPSSQKTSSVPVSILDENSLTLFSFYEKQAAAEQIRDREAKSSKFVERQDLAPDRLQREEDGDGLETCNVIQGIGKDKGTEVSAGCVETLETKSKVDDSSSGYFIGNRHPVASDPVGDVRHSSDCKESNTLSASKIEDFPDLGFPSIHEANPGDDDKGKGEAKVPSMFSNKNPKLPINILKTSELPRLSTIDNIDNLETSDSTFDRMLSSPNSVIVMPVGFCYSTLEKNFNVVDTCLRNILGGLKASKDQSKATDVVKIDGLAAQSQKAVERPGSGDQALDGEAGESDMVGSAMNHDSEDVKENVAVSGSEMEGADLLRSPSHSTENFHNCSVTISTPFVLKETGVNDESPHKLNESLSMPASLSSLKDEGDKRRFGFKSRHKSAFSRSILKMQKSKWNPSTTLAKNSQQRRVIACNIAHSPFIPSHCKMKAPSRRITPTEVSFSTPSPLQITSPCSPAEFIIDLAPSPSPTSGLARDSNNTSSVTKFVGKEALVRSSIKNSIGKEMDNNIIQLTAKTSHGEDSEDERQRQVRNDSLQADCQRKDNRVMTKLSDGELHKTQSVCTSPNSSMSQSKNRGNDEENIQPRLKSVRKKLVLEDSVSNSNSALNNAFVGEMVKNAHVSNREDVNDCSDTSAKGNFRREENRAQRRAPSVSELGRSNHETSQSCLGLPSSPSQRKPRRIVPQLISKTVSKASAEHFFSSSSCQGKSRLWQEEVKVVSSSSDPPSPHSDAEAFRILKTISQSYSKPQPSQEITSSIADVDTLPAPSPSMKKCGCLSREVCTHVKGKHRKTSKKLEGIAQKSKQNKQSWCGSLEKSGEEKSSHDGRDCISLEDLQGVCDSSSKDFDKALSGNNLLKEHDDGGKAIQVSSGSSMAAEADKLIPKRDASPGRDCSYASAPEEISRNQTNLEQSKTVPVDLHMDNSEGESSVKPKGNVEATNDSIFPSGLPREQFEDQNSMSVAAPYFPELSNTADFFKLKQSGDDESNGTSIRFQNLLGQSNPSDKSVVNSTQHLLTETEPSVQFSEYPVVTPGGDNCLLTQAMKQCGIPLEPNELSLLEASQFPDLDLISTDTSHAVEVNTQEQITPRETTGNILVNPRPEPLSQQTSDIFQVPCQPPAGQKRSSKRIKKKAGSKISSGQKPIIPSSSNYLPGALTSDLGVGKIAYLRQPNQTPIPFVILPDGKLIILDASVNANLPAPPSNTPSQPLPPPSIPSAKASDPLPVPSSQAVPPVKSKTKTKLKSSETRSKKPLSSKSAKKLQKLSTNKRRKPSPPSSRSPPCVNVQKVAQRRKIKDIVTSPKKAAVSTYFKKSKAKRKLSLASPSPSKQSEYTQEGSEKNAASGSGSELGRKCDSNKAVEVDSIVEKSAGAEESLEIQEETENVPVSPNSRKTQPDNIEVPKVAKRLRVPSEKPASLSQREEEQSQKSTSTLSSNTGEICDQNENVAKTGVLNDHDDAMELSQLKCFQSPKKKVSHSEMREVSTKKIRVKFSPSKNKNDFDGSPVSKKSPKKSMDTNSTEAKGLSPKKRESLCETVPVCMEQSETSVNKKEGKTMSGRTTLRSDSSEGKSLRKPHIERKSECTSGTFGQDSKKRKCPPKKRKELSKDVVDGRSPDIEECTRTTDFNKEAGKDYVNGLSSSSKSETGTVKVGEKSGSKSFSDILFDIAVECKNKEANRTSPNAQPRSRSMEHHGLGRDRNEKAEAGQSKRRKRGSSSGGGICDDTDEEPSPSWATIIRGKSVKVVIDDEGEMIKDKSDTNVRPYYHGRKGSNGDGLGPSQSSPQKSQDSSLKRETDQGECGFVSQVVADELKLEVGKKTRKWEEDGGQVKRNKENPQKRMAVKSRNENNVVQSGEQRKRKAGTSLSLCKDKRRKKDKIVENELSLHNELKNIGKSEVVSGVKGNGKGGGREIFEYKHKTTTAEENMQRLAPENGLELLSFVALDTQFNSKHKDASDSLLCLDEKLSESEVSDESFSHIDLKSYPPLRQPEFSLIPTNLSYQPELPNLPTISHDISLPRRPTGFSPSTTKLPSRVEVNGSSDVSRNRDLASNLSREDEDSSHIQSSPILSSSVRRADANDQPSLVTCSNAALPTSTEAPKPATTTHAPKSATTNSAPKPATTKTPAPKPATTTHAPKPATTKTPAPKPATTQTPSPKPATTKTPAPKPATTKTPAPKPATTTHVPKPATTKTPAPKPATTTHVPKPATTNSAPKPATTKTPSPKPATMKTPAPKPATTKTPAPKPATTKTPAPKPATTTPAPKPATTQTPSPKPATTKTPAPKPATSTPAPKPATTTASKPATMNSAPKPATMNSAPKPATTTPAPKPATRTTTPASKAATTKTPAPKPATSTPAPKPATTTPAPKPATTTASKPATMNSAPKPATMNSAPKPATMTPAPKPATRTTTPASKADTTKTPAPKPVTANSAPKPATSTPASKAATTKTPTPKPVTTTPAPKPALTTTTPSSKSATTSAPKPATTTPAPKPATTTPAPKPATTTPAPKPATTTPAPKPATTTPAPKPATTTPAPKPATTTPAPNQSLPLAQDHTKTLKSTFSPSTMTSSVLTPTSKSAVLTSTPTLAETPNSDSATVSTSNPSATASSKSISKKKINKLINKLYKTPPQHGS